MFVLIFFLLFYLMGYNVNVSPANLWIYFIAILLLTLLVTINIVKKQDKVNYDDMYNKVFILTLIFTGVILLRVFLDSYLLGRELNPPAYINEVYFSNNSSLISIPLLLLSFNNIVIMYKKDNPIIKTKKAAKKTSK
jgi:regulatory protein YycH of two-component signal transduction system YycFG